MKSFICKIKGTTSYQGGRFHNEPKLPRETAQDYEDRTWKGRLHVSDDGEVVIPPMAFKNMLKGTAKFLGIQVPGKGKRTYGKIFERGILVQFPAGLGVSSDDVLKETHFVSAGGKAGQGTSTRVIRHFPTVPPGWEAEFQVEAIDDAVTKDVLQEHLIAAGKLTGLGVFRPENGGFNGMFEVQSVKEVK